MRVIVAKTAGFCMGVRRAMDILLDAANEKSDGKVYTDGPLIHNPQVLEYLEKETFTSLMARQTFLKPQLLSGRTALRPPVEKKSKIWVQRSVTLPVLM